MKTNDLDDLFKKKKTSNTSFYLKIVIVIFAFLMPLGTIYYMGKVDNTLMKSRPMVSNMEKVIFLNIKEKFMFLP